MQGESIGGWRIVKKIVGEADIIIEVADARFPIQSRNFEAERIAKAWGKKLVIVLNKSDLVSKRHAKAEKALLEGTGVFVSAKNRRGITRLKKIIAAAGGMRDSKVAVIGYPNTGKSSIINRLSGRRSARTSSEAGFTRGKQFVRLNKKTMLIDSPGVIPIGEKNEALMAMLGAKNAHQLKDIEGTGIEIAETLMKSSAGLENAYGIKADSGDEFLEKLALKKGRLLQRGKPDLNAAARLFIEDFQKGRIGLGWQKAGQVFGKKNR